ncbi:MAG: 4Fe-4S binding protein [Spirochaetales bacterium]
MTIKEIFNCFEKIGCLTFATINENAEPETRIAHLRAYDEEGIYFMTMHTKSFYRQLKETKKISVCGLCADSHILHDENGFPVFDKGYAIRMTGKVKEIPMSIIKAKNNPMFDFCIKDQEKYNAMVVFCIYVARGDIFDYDFEKTERDTKLERIYFSYNGEPIQYKGLTINRQTCISCGLCKQTCSFLAISEQDTVYSIDNRRCDECGDCFMHCPVGAIEVGR